MSLAFATSAQGGATFTVLGGLPTSPPYTPTSTVRGVSADGLVAVGESYVNAYRQAFRWSEAEGMIALGPPTGLSRESVAFATSADGASVVGWRQAAPFSLEAFRWSATEGMLGLGNFNPAGGASVSHAVSADGSVVVGKGSGSGLLAFRWTAATGLRLLVPEPGAIAPTIAWGVSGDGRVVVGRADVFGGGIQAVRWTEAEGAVVLGRPPGGTGRTEALAISADGTTIVGFSWGDPRSQAFRWSEQDGMQGLGDLPGGDFQSEALAVSADGSIVVGRATSGTFALREAFIWDPVHGMRGLKQLLTDHFGLDLTGWSLWEAVGVSADGRVIVGNGGNATTAAWRIVLPPACEDGLDNDGDGSIDRAGGDPGCGTGGDGSERDASLVCDDGLDNDGDRRIDVFEDAGCEGPLDDSERSHVECDDGLDNDGDGRTDANEDPGCDDPGDTSERSSSLACDNGVDDDGNGWTDLLDYWGCIAPDDPSEHPDCSDGIDNDGDTWIDAGEDPGCAGPHHRLEDPQCDDGLDNDGDDGVDAYGGRLAVSPDDECRGEAWRDREAPRSACGLGFELVPAAWWLTRRARLRERQRRALSP